MQPSLFDTLTPREPYNGEPPHVAGSETSLEAAEFIKPNKVAMEQKILRFIKERGEEGAICDEIEASLGFKHQTCSARVRGLYLSGKIEKTKHKRRTRSGCNAAVYIARAL